MAGTSSAMKSPPRSRPDPVSHPTMAVTKTETAMDEMVRANVASGTPVRRISFRSILVCSVRTLREQQFLATRCADSTPHRAAHLVDSRLRFGQTEASLPPVLDDRLDDLTLINEVLDYRS